MTGTKNNVQLTEKIQQLEESLEQKDEQISELNRRVNYLEAELEMSYEQQQFKNSVRSVFRQNGEILNIYTDGSIEWTADAHVDTEYIPYIVKQVEDYHSDWEWETTDDEGAVRFTVRQPRR